MEIARGGARQGWLTLAVAVPPRSEGKISKSNKKPTLSHSHSLTSGGRTAATSSQMLSFYWHITRADGVGSFKKKDASLLGEEKA